MVELHQSNGMTNGVGGHHSPVARLDVDALYSGTRLLILGGTGFLGKIFWVLLLDRFPTIERIYLMVRSTKDKTSEERFTEILSGEALRPLRDKYGDGYEAFVRSRIVPIDGDMSRPLCGVDPKLAAELKGTIHAVVNVAGVVDFNPPLDESIEANAFGARNLIALSRALGEAPIFHTSTTMVVGDRLGSIVEEDPMVHPFPRSDELGADIWNPEREIDECLELCAQARHRCEDGFRQSDFAEKAKKALAARGEPSDGAAFTAELAKVKRKFIKDQLVHAGQDRAKHWGWPNIYTYTKSIGEQIISRSGVRYTIVRPASCESTHHFPFKGYNEGIGTSAPFIFLAMKGHVQFPAADDILLEFIPSDYVCVGMALALAELLEGSQKPIYQYAVGEVNPCSSARFAELMGIYKRKSYQKSNKGNALVNFIQAHIEPVAVTTDRLDIVGPKAFARMGRQVAHVMKGFGPLGPAAKAIESFAAQEQKIGEMLDLFAPFTTIQKGPFSAANTRSAYARLSPADKLRLPWEPEKLDWPDYWMTAHMPAIESRVIPEIERRMKKELAPLAAHETLLTLLEQMARRHEVAVALSYTEDTGLTRVTYQDLRARAASTAARLAASGVSKGDRVVLMAHNHPDWAVAYFGILWAGATAVPVDPTFTHDAVSRIVKESGARAVVWDAKVKDHVLAGGTIGATALDVHEATEEDPELAPPPAQVEPDDIASLLYTSGTTAAPKGVMLTHANFTSLIAGLAPLFPLKPGDRVLSVLPLHHTFEFTCGLLLPLSRGGRVVYIGDVTPERLGRGLELGRVTAMVGVPALWQLLERRILTQVKAKGPVAETAFNLGTELNRFLGKKLGVDIGRALFGSVHEGLGGKVRYLISGGAALPHGTHKLFAGLGLPLVEGYGLTEAAPVLTVTRGKSRAGQVGKAVPGVEIKIADANEDGVGEVLAKGPNVMAGYTDVQATAAAIDADGWLHTGDLGKLDKHGHLSIVGRLKDVIVTATGENVHPDDLEREIGQVEHILELAIVGVEARGAERIGCLAVPAEAPGLERGARNERSLKSLRAAIGKLPFGKQPAIVHLYEAPLPRTATRKVKRTEVKEILGRMVLATAPVHADGKTSAVRVAIGAIRARAPETLSGDATLHDDLGFDSLALSELLVALEAKFGVIDPAALQACRTVADIEALVGVRRDTLPPKPRAEKTVTPDEGERIVLPVQMQEAGKRFIGKLQDAFYGRLMNARVYGRAHIPHNRNTIVVANHSSHLDMGFVRHALGTYGEDIVSLAAQDYFFDKSPLRRAFFENLTNLRAIDRKGGLRASERQAAEIIAEGRTMLIFPEGTRSPDGQIHDFKPILGHLALTYGVDILPVHIAGTRESMPKGSRLPSSRDIVARIGAPLTVSELRRLTAGMTPADASREVSRLAQQAVVLLGSGDMLDLSQLSRDENGKPKSLAPKKEHPLVTLFAELESKFKPGTVERAISFYFTLGGDPLAKWTVKVDPKACEIKVGKPEGSAADCVLKTTPEIFARIVRDAYTPGPAEFLSGAVKSNDVELLLTFQRAFELG